MAAPSITDVLPKTIAAGSQTTTLKVMGTNFPAQAAILWNGAALPTTAIDGNTLSGTIGSGNIATPATVQLKVQNTQTKESSQAVPLVIAPANSASPLTISLTPLPQAVVNAPYSGTLGVTGGTSPYIWSIATGQLPAGLSLAANTGIISGTPAVSGSYSFGISVVDSNSSAQSASATVTLSVAKAAATSTSLTISSSLPSGNIGSGYSTPLQASGGTPPYTWSFVSGNLPAGLSFDTSTGLIYGTPTAIGTASFTAAVADSANPAQTKSATLLLVVAPAPLAITTSSLSSATIGSAYSSPLQVSGGTAPYAWSITAGSLPAGLSLAPTTGIISGTPTASGNVSFTATVADAGNPAQTKSVTLSLVAAPATLTITSSALLAGTQSSNYSSALQASGGTAPYTWSISPGSSLPADLSLAASTGIISGKPTGNGNFSFGVTVKDSGSPAQNTTATVTLSLVQAGSPLAISTTSLSGGITNASFSTSLNATGGATPYTWSITQGTLPAGLSLAAATGTISGTPTTVGTASLNFKVADSSSPVQTKSVTLSLAITAPQLTITTTSLSSGTNGVAYSAPMTATGGTPAYTWSVTAGALPSGLTMSASSGLISGTPTASGTYNFTATVADNSTPNQTKSAATSIVVAAAQASGPGTTWYVRPDGGTRYSSNVPSGQCNGQYDASYASTGGTGTNQNCAFNDFRFLWDDESGAVGAGTWVIAGGDTVIVRGCTASANQSNPSNPDCRIGWDAPTGTGANLWCYGVGSYTCYNPPIPAGTATQHTRILGQCAYGVYSCTPVNTYPLASNNLTQIFGGFSLNETLNLSSTQYVDIEGIELTTHNGVCTRNGSPSYPRGCITSQPLDDYAQNGFLTNNTTANITFQDVYVHGFNASGFFGPIGGPITMTRVFIGFNGMSGWNFDDGNDTADGVGSSITASYVTMEGNGCYEEYPIVHTGFPAHACYDSISNGFGDGWSGQDTELSSFICDHCALLYNTKDGFIGPHTQIDTLRITNSVALGNMGAQWKWAGNINGTILFQNNLTVTNCIRMAEALPGAAQNFALSTGLGGSYLANFCRAGGAGFANVERAGEVNNYYGNTIVAAGNIVFQEGCGYYSVGNVFNPETNCGSTINTLKDNNFLGYTDPNPILGVPSALYCALSTNSTCNLISDGGVQFTGFYNNEIGFKGGTTDTCGTNNITCVNPLMVSQPAGPWPGSEAALDVFNPFVGGNSFYPTSGSPLLGAGTTITGLTTDYFGTATTNPPVIGAVQP